MTTFITFDQFISQTSEARPGSYRDFSGGGIDPQCFEEMKNHILSLYRGLHSIHSFVLPSGQYVDCIPIHYQPSLRVGGDTYLKLADPPEISLPLPQAPKELAEKDRLVLASSQLQKGTDDPFGNEQCCPPGTIPMRRVTLEQIAPFRTLQDYLSKRGGLSLQARIEASGSPIVKARDTATHRYAIGSQQVANVGAGSFLNVWSPHPTAGNFSLSQIWVTGGTGDKLQTVEAGWQVYPDHYGTNKAVLFIYWTRDDYKTTGNYNLEAPAFVQTDSSMVLGGEFAQYSASGGTQVEFGVLWSRDKSGNWWLWIAKFGQVLFSPFGYYPRSLFGSGQLTISSDNCEFGGEVTGVASGQMGSGEAASAGFYHAAYQRQQMYTTAQSITLPTNLTFYQSNPTCYTISWAPTIVDGGFFFGGPGCS
jgi:hypothetical protein